jgi:hypothetical protein
MVQHTLEVKTQLYYYMYIQQTMVTANNYMFRPLPHIEASTDAAFVLLIPHQTPHSSHSATHRELYPRALLLISSS